MRGRIRSIKPEVHTDEDLWDLEVETGLPIFRAFTGLWNYADREGRFEWRPRALKTLILPYWTGDFAAVMDALASRSFIVRYAVDGRDYGLVRTFASHQVINNKEQASTLPSPDSRDANATATRGRRDGFVYLATYPGSGAFKVGFSHRDPSARVSDLSCGSPEPLVLVEQITGSVDLETQIHQALAAHHKHREWFHSTDESVRALSAWFSRDPRVTGLEILSRGEGNGKEGNGKEGSAASARGKAPPPSSSPQVITEIRTIGSGGVGRTITLPSEQPPKDYLDDAVMRGISREQAASTWEHYWGAGLPQGGVERLHDWLLKRAKERSNSQARAGPRAAPKGVPVAQGMREWQAVEKARSDAVDAEYERKKTLKTSLKTQ